MARSANAPCWTLRIVSRRVKPGLPPPWLPCIRPSTAGGKLRRSGLPRTCYDHLAGVAGVALFETMLAQGWLIGGMDAETGRPCYHLTSVGQQALSVRGVDVAHAEKRKRRFAYGCLDWTERRPHLGGALAAAILEALRQTGMVRRQRQARTVTLRQPLDRWLAAARPLRPGE